MPSPRRQLDTEPTVALSTVPEPAPFQALLEVMALRVALRPPSPSAMLAWPRLSTITLGSLSQVRRGLRRTYAEREPATRQATTKRADREMILVFVMI